MRKTSPTPVIFWIIILSTTFILTALAEDNRAEVSLTVSVIAPEYRTYFGRGLLYIEDQRASRKAYLYVPQDTEHPIKLELIKGKKIVASWEWDIMSHETKTIERKKHDIVIDTYQCEDSDERSLWVEITTHLRSKKKTSRALAIGEGAFFSGREHKQKIKTKRP